MKRRDFVAYSGAGLMAAVAPATVAKVGQPVLVPGMANKIGKTFVCTDTDGVQHRMKLSAVHELDGGPQVEQFTLEFKTADNVQLDGLFWVEEKGQRGEMLSMQAGGQGQASASFARLKA